MWVRRGGAGAAHQNSQNLPAACFSSPTAGIHPLPWEYVLLRKCFLQKKKTKNQKTNDQPRTKWLKCVLPTASLQREWLPPPMERSHHQNCSRQPDHSLTCWVTATRAAPDQKQLLRLVHQANLCPKHEAKATLPLTLPSRLWGCQELAQQEVCGTLPTAPDLASKTKCLCQTLPVNRSSVQAPAWSTEGTSICRSCLGVAKVPVPSSHFVTSPRQGTAQALWGQEGYREKNSENLSSFSQHSISHLHPASASLGINRLDISSSWEMLQRGRTPNNAIYRDTSLELYLD